MARDEARHGPFLNRALVASGIEIDYKLSTKRADHWFPLAGVLYGLLSGKDRLMR